MGLARPRIVGGEKRRTQTTFSAIMLEFLVSDVQRKVQGSLERTSIEMIEMAMKGTVARPNIHCTQMAGISFLGTMKKLLKSARRHCMTSFSFIVWTP
jgi:hypothetical protein